MNQTNSLMVAIFVALGVVLVAGLVIIPEIEQQAALADKGGIPNDNSAGHGRGRLHL
jgi:hypothetical protein